MMLRRRPRSLWDRRRWRTAWATLADDAFLFIGARTDDAGRPMRMTIGAIAPNDEARLQMIEVAEQLPNVVRAGWFDDLERDGGWVVDEAPKVPVEEPEPGRMNDPRRRAAAIEALRADAF